MATCTICNSFELEYLGIEDGTGDYGDAVCDVFRCLECGHTFEANCLSFEPDEPAPSDEPTRFHNELDNDAQYTFDGGTNPKKDNHDDIPF